jgi:hypothetical protein
MADLIAKKVSYHNNPNPTHNQSHLCDLLPHNNLGLPLQPSSRGEEMTPVPFLFLPSPTTPTHTDPTKLKHRDERVQNKSVSQGIGGGSWCGSISVLGEGLRQ